MTDQKQKLRDFLISMEFLKIDTMSEALYGKGSKKLLALFKIGRAKLTEERAEQLKNELQKYGYGG